MAAVVIDTNDAYTRLYQAIKSSVATLPGLGLASVAVGSNGATSSYRASQKRLADEFGISFKSVDCDESISLGEFEKIISQLNCDSSIQGIILNKPFLPEWSESRIFSLIAPAKDVEGLHPVNLGTLFNIQIDLETFLNPENLPHGVSPTVLSILHCLKLARLQSLRGKRVVIVSSSVLIGKPLAILCINSFASTSCVHIATTQAGDLASYIQDADVVVTAAGVPGLIKGDWIKEGAVVIDAGCATQDNKLLGDVGFESASRKASYITPVPQGVGRLTPLYLFFNLIFSATEVCNLND